MCIVPALMFFSLNKVFLNYINARSEMIAYAVFQALRNIFICVGIIILAVLKVAGVALTSVFFWEEGVLFLLMLIYLLKKKELCGKTSLKNGKKLVSFGIRIMPSNVVLEITTKVDLICLGWFISNEAIVGVYSFVSLISEGFYQVYMVMRRMINPKLTLWVQKKDIWEKKYKFIKKICLIVAVPLVLLIWLAFYLMIIILNKPIYGQGIIPLIIVASSIASNGLFIIYGNSMSLLGYPGRESIINIITVACNFILNIIFIARWGIIGAAVATAISYCCFSVFIYMFLKKGIKNCKLSYI
jgi:O-antigen/teichoic acid export membrane protein